MKDSYREPAEQISAELKVKKSRFIARVVPVLSQSEAEEALATIKRQEYNATHNCSAFRVGADGLEFRFNDDGEPSGTAGMPILRHIEGRDLTNTLVVVTRYYGGVKLGAGGLVRAYGDTAAAALDQVRVRERIIRVPLSATFDYDDTSPAMHTIGRFDIDIVGTDYGNRTTLHLAVRLADADPFREAFVEALGGRGALDDRIAP